MYEVSFWKATGERALRTFAQALVALIGADQINVIDLDWTGMFGIAATAAIVSVLTSIVASGVGEPGPSFGQETEINK